MGFVETLIHFKAPPLSLLSSVHRALGGLPYSNIVPVNWYVHIFIYSMSIYALSHTRFKNYVCVSADCSIGKGDSAILLHLITLRKECVFVRQSK